MGIEGVENLTDQETQPGADDPTPTTDPAVPGDDPVQQQFETPTTPDVGQSDEPETLE